MATSAKAIEGGQDSKRALVRRAMEEGGVSYRDLAQRVGVQSPVISDFLNGSGDGLQEREGRRALYWRVCSALGISEDLAIRAASKDLEQQGRISLLELGVARLRAQMNPSRAASSAEKGYSPQTHPEQGKRKRSLSDLGAHRPMSAVRVS